MDLLRDNDLAVLLRDAQQGSTEAFRAIFEHLSPRLFTYVFSRTSHRDDALDIVQETFIELWRALSNGFRYNSDEQFYGFVFVIAKRKLYRYFKSKRVTNPLNEHTIQETYEAEFDDYQSLFKHLNALTAHYRELLQLRYWSDMTFGEIASVMNVKEATAKVWHHRALKKLQILMQSYDNTI